MVPYSSLISNIYSKHNKRSPPCLCNTMVWYVMACVLGVTIHWSSTSKLAIRH